MSYLLDFTVVVLDTTGNCEWDFIYGQPGEYDRANVVIHDNNRVYAGGYFSTVSNGYDLAIVCMSENGDTSWIYRFNGTGNGNDVAQDLIFGLDCYLYTCGWCLDSIGQKNLLAVRLDTSGVEKWYYTYDGSAGDVDIANSLIFGSDDDIYVAGCTTDSLSSLDFIVICLDTTNTGSIENKTESISGVAKILPTIFTDPLLLSYDKPCKIFDITGREVKPHLLRPGIYFIEVDGEIKQKVVKVR